MYKDPVKKAASKRRYYLKHREKICAYAREYKLNHPEKFKKNFIKKRCLWCLEIIGLNRIKFCNDSCDDRHKHYKDRFMPLSFWRFYSKYKIYKLIYSYLPKYRRILLRSGPKIFLKFFFKILKLFRKIKTYLNYHKFYLCKTKKCNHWVFYISKGFTRSIKNKRNFCSLKCKEIYNQKIKQGLIQRNLSSWGTEERPGKETRRIIRNKKHLEYDKTRKKKDPAYKLIRRMRTKTQQVLHKVQTRRKRNPIGIYERLCVKNGEELKIYLESLWEPGMTWDNYGTKNGWVIDHKTPLKYYIHNFDLANDLEAQKKAFGKENLQPLWWVDNAHKSAKLNYEFKSSRY